MKQWTNKTTGNTREYFETGDLKKANAFTTEAIEETVKSKYVWKAGKLYIAAEKCYNGYLQKELAGLYPEFVNVLINPEQEMIRIENEKKATKVEETVSPAVEEPKPETTETQLTGEQSPAVEVEIELINGKIPPSALENLQPNGSGHRNVQLSTPAGWVREKEERRVVDRAWTFSCFQVGDQFTVSSINCADDRLASGCVVGVRSRKFEITSIAIPGNRLILKEIENKYEKRGHYPRYGKN